MLEFDALDTPPMRVVRPHEVRSRLGVSRSKFADMVAKGQFPKPFYIIPGGRAVGWLQRDVDAWILNRSSNDVRAAA
ncbi:MAG: hypothetical protein RL425_1351 [Pseudomonadota bacterium]